MGIKIRSKQLTPRQSQILRYIQNFKNRNCYSPTIAETAKRLGVSRPTAFEHIAALQQKRLLTKPKGRARSLNLTRRASRLLESLSHPPDDAVVPDSRVVPDDSVIASVAAAPVSVSESNVVPAMRLLGTVAAGAPIEAIENAEPISMTELFGNDDTFVLRVTGESMIEEGIFDGDYVVCKRTSTAENGQLVVAIVDDDDATLKRFYKETAGLVRLQPSNAAYEPIYTDNCRIEAVVQGLLRKL